MAYTRTLYAESVHSSHKIENSKKKKETAAAERTHTQKYGDDLAQLLQIGSASRCRIQQSSHTHTQ